MRPDVVDLRHFYASPLGQMARRFLRLKMRVFWPDVDNLRVLGLGYATPFLSQFRESSERVLALMPAQQGVIHWPREGARLIGLCEEGNLPLPDASIDRIVWIHGLEHSLDANLALQEIWRVLVSTGKLLVVVPNRRGLWSRFEGTPFGQGRPYSQPQVARLLRDNLFTPTGHAGSLYFPPSRFRFNLRMARLWERAGPKLWPGFAGVVCQEADKQVFAIGDGAKKVHRRSPVIIGAAQPGFPPAYSRRFPPPHR